ncbi:MAG TPA: hypothetical protein VJL58_03935 [Pyrinomonadaceae bacterium]|nr:hypothetical protein [Pyrinomonadaceae bacterium]
MKLSKESAVELARQDLAKRLGVAESEVTIGAVTPKDFPDMALGTPLDGEMAAQMISGGWEIDLNASGKSYEYRADKYHLRLRNFGGQNHIIKQ